MTKVEVLNLTLAIVAIVIAAFGGLPGILEIIRYRRDMPKLVFQLHGMMHGYLSTGGGKSLSMVMFTGAVSNESEKPIVPAFFDLEVKVEDTWQHFKRVPIPKSMQAVNEVNQVNYDKPSENDLQNVKSAITSSTPAYGHLMFHTDYTREQLEAAKGWRIVCTDLLNRKYEMPLTIENWGNKSAAPLPKFGVTVTSPPTDTIQ